MVVSPYIKRGVLCANAVLLPLTVSFLFILVPQSSQCSARPAYNISFVEGNEGTTPTPTTTISISA